MCSRGNARQFNNLGNLAFKLVETVSPNPYPFDYSLINQRLEVITESPFAYFRQKFLQFSNPAIAVLPQSFQNCRLPDR